VNPSKQRKFLAGDFGEFGTLDVLRSIAICDHLNDSDQEKFDARMELLRRNQDLETQPLSKMSKNIERFIGNPAKPNPKLESQDYSSFDGKDAYFARTCMIATIQLAMATRTVSGEDSDTDEDSDEDDSSHGDEDINENVRVSHTQNMTNPSHPIAIV